MYETTREDAINRAKALLMRFGHTSDTAEPFLSTKAGLAMLAEVEAHLRREEDLASALHGAIKAAR